MPVSGNLFPRPSADPWREHRRDGVFLGIHRVVVGDTKIYPGYLDLMREHDVEVIVVDDPDCLALAEHFRDG